MNPTARRPGTRPRLRRSMGLSIVHRPRLLDDARSVAEGDLGSGPALDRGGEGGAGEA